MGFESFSRNLQKENKKVERKFLFFPFSSFMQVQFQREASLLFGPLGEHEPRLHSGVICRDIEMGKGD